MSTAPRITSFFKPKPKVSGQENNDHLMAVAESGDRVINAGKAAVAMKAAKNDVKPAPTKKGKAVVKRKSKNSAPKERKRAAPPKKKRAKKAAEFIVSDTEESYSSTDASSEDEDERKKKAKGKRHVIVISDDDDDDDEEAVVAVKKEVDKKYRPELRNQLITDAWSSQPKSSSITPRAAASKKAEIVEEEEVAPDAFFKKKMITRVPVTKSSYFHTEPNIRSSSPIAEEASIPPPSSSTDSVWVSPIVDDDDSFKAVAAPMSPPKRDNDVWVSPLLLTPSPLPIKSRTQPPVAVAMAAESAMQIDTLYCDVESETAPAMLSPSPVAATLAPTPIKSPVAGRQAPATPPPVAQAAASTLPPSVALQACSSAPQSPPDMMEKKKMKEEKPMKDDNTEKEEKTVILPATRARATKWFPGQQRAAPPRLGMKPIPTGSPNCLSGKRFVLTGVLDSIERDDCSDLIKRLGGFVTTAVSGKTTHLIAGEGASDMKIEMAREKKIHILDEDALFDLIARSKSKESPSSSSKCAAASKMAAVRPAQAASSDSDLMWVDKYKPVSSADLCANPGCIAKLKEFLIKWPHTEGGKHAVLLSGPPGIGKSSAAAICAKEAGYTIIEMNASTTRSKKELKAHISQLLQCHSMSEYCRSATNRKAEAASKKTLLIMDEVDGMSSGDRGGMQELCALIKNSKVPIVCICNDRSSPKVRSLANYCIDLRFRRPMASQILKRMASIAAAEGLRVDEATLNKICETTNGDIRQMLNMLQLCRSSSTSISFDDAKSSAMKDFEKNAFSMVPELFHPVNVHQVTDFLTTRMDTYFIDPSLVPLMVQGNYLSSMPLLFPSEHQRPKQGVELAYLERFASAADSISDGDLVDRQIRGSQSWGLMPLHAVLSTVAPAFYVAGKLGGQVEFPQWLGKNSTRSKNNRLLSELRSHMSSRTSAASNDDVCLDYLPVLRRRLTDPLCGDRGLGGIDEVVGIMNYYHLRRTDLDTLLELGASLYGKIAIDTKTKTAFTRTFNQRTTSYVDKDLKKKRGGGDADDGLERLIGDEEGELSDIGAESDDDDAGDDDAPAAKPVKATSSKKAASGKAPAKRKVAPKKAPVKSKKARGT